MKNELKLKTAWLILGILVIPELLFWLSAFLDKKLLPDWLLLPFLLFLFSPLSLIKLALVIFAALQFWFLAKKDLQGTLQDPFSSALAGVVIATLYAIYLACFLIKDLFTVYPSY